MGQRPPQYLEREDTITCVTPLLEKSSLFHWWQSHKFSYQLPLDPAGGLPLKPNPLLCPQTMKIDQRLCARGTDVIHGSLGPLESSAQTTSRSVQPFLQGSLM